MDIDKFFSAFTYTPSNPFTIEDTLPSQPGQPLPTPAPPLHNASSWKMSGRGRWRSSKNPSPCARNRTSSMLAVSTSSSSVTATTGSGKPVVVSRYFLPSHASSVLTDAKSIPHRAPHSKASGANGARNQTSSMLAVSTSSSYVTTTTGSGKPVVVSRYFLPSHASSVLTDAKSSPLRAPHSKAPGANGSRNQTSSMLAVSTSSSSATATTDSGKPVVVSRYFLPSHASSSVLTDTKSSPLRPPHSKASGANGKKLMVKRDCDGVDPNKQTKKRRAKKEPYFSAADKKSDAYRRVADNNTWDPPTSCYHLLQERYSFDPWRVLIICMLLNITTGIQVRKALPGLFLLCPNAEAMSKIDEEEVEKVIRPLGLQKKRSRMLKRFSCEYLRDDWVYVTELHGIGKYAADAYAIFCTGKMKQIIPRDHKLVAYWKLLCGEEFYFENGMN